MDSQRKMSDEMRKLLRELLRSPDRLAQAGLATGIILVVLGVIVGEAGFGIGGAIGTLGWLLLMCGIAFLVLGDSRRRAAAIDISKRTYYRYMQRTAGWNWPYRAGLAGVVVGLALIILALVLQMALKGVGTAVGGLGLILFWGGALLLIYGWFQGRDGDPPSSASRKEAEAKTLAILGGARSSTRHQQASSGNGDGGGRP